MKKIIIILIALWFVQTSYADAIPEWVELHPCLENYKTVNFWRKDVNFSIEEMNYVAEKIRWADCRNVLFESYTLSQDKSNYIVQFKDTSTNSTYIQKDWETIFKYTQESTPQNIFELKISYLVSRDVSKVFPTIFVWEFDSSFQTQEYYKDILWVYYNWKKIFWDLENDKLSVTLNADLFKEQKRIESYFHSSDVTEKLWYTYDFYLDQTKREKIDSTVEKFLQTKNNPNYEKKFYTYVAKKRNQLEIRYYAMTPWIYWNSKIKLKESLTWIITQEEYKKFRESYSWMTPQPDLKLNEQEYKMFILLEYLHAQHELKKLSNW